jgi:hypothetical protein
MATKKTASSTKKIPAKKATKNLVLRFHSNLDDPDIVHESPKFYSESGQGWVSDVESATRYDAGGADKIMLELLKEELVASELVDLNDAPQNLFALHTAFLDDGHIPQVIVKVPQFVGDTYRTVPSDENWYEEDLVDMFKSDEFSILWDPERSVVPDDNKEFLSAHGVE